jgi:hypothetical protein
LQVLLRDLQHEPAQLFHGTTGKARRLLISSKTPSCFSRSVSLFSSFQP